jgi:SAM-dependent methyltransferase
VTGGRRAVRAAALSLPAPVRARVLPAPLRFPPAALAFDQTPFGEVRLPGGGTVVLRQGYRTAVKSWAGALWVVAALRGLAARIELPPDLARLDAQLRGARTLELPAAELAALLEPLADAHPEHLRRGELDAVTRSATLHLVPTDDDLDARRALESRSAAAVLRRLGWHGLDVPRVRVLEVGCGVGYTTCALAEAGVALAAGVDHMSGAWLDDERARLAARAGGRAELYGADVHELPFPDASFDAVVSFSVFEHVRDPAQVLRENARVLRPGGLALHVVQPWFGPAGGHSLCTLDFPWGHARLDDEGIDRYLAEHRPHEQPYASASLRADYQQPRLTGREVAASAADAGLAVAEWQEERWRVARHRPLLTDAVVADVRRIHPRVRRSDLLLDIYSMVLRRR